MRTKSGTIAIIGAGPAGLMAAECLAQSGHKVDVYEKKPSVARKFLMAGRGGLNLTHSEPLDSFLMRYGEASAFLRPALTAFTPDDLRDWCARLGESTFIGTSGRVFPKSFKSSPLLRAWLKRLGELGVTIHTGYHWAGELDIPYDATILALGGASWPKLGSTGSWTTLLAREGIEIAPLRPANCGFRCVWSDVFKSRFAGTPLKQIRLTHLGLSASGEIMVSELGLEGGAIYALSKFLRISIEQSGTATLFIDLKPDITEEQLGQRLTKPRGRDTMTNFLRKQTGLSPAAINLLYECADMDKPLAPQIKNLRVEMTSPFPIERAISSAGGIKLSELDENYMLKKMPGTFIAGEMLDWEAPTGGYLLQACFSMGVFVAQRVDKYIKTGKIAA